MIGASAAPPGQTGVSGVSLRGLGSGSTLVLVDGRRVVQSGSGNRSTDSRQGFVDLNTIPLAMVDRIEVITDGASALYGADAVAGVINIVMKKDWTGGELTTNVHSAFDGGGRERQGSFTYGFTSGPIRGNISLQGYDRLPLKASERDFSADQNHTDVVAGYNATTGEPIFGRDFRLNWGYPGVIQTALFNETLNGITDPAGNPTRFAIVNPGVTGMPTVNDFTGITANFASGAVRGNTAEFLDLIPESSRWSASGNLNFNINDNVESYATYTISDTRGMFNGQANVSSAATSSGFGNFSTVIPAAFNPFGQNIAVGLVHYEFGSTWQKTQTRAHNAVLGVRGVIGQSSWQWDSYVGYQKQVFHQLGRAFNGAAITAALSNPDPAMRLNPFIDARAAGITQADIYETMAVYPTLDTESDMRSVDVTADGELFDLPGGTVRMGVGGFFERNTNQSFSVNYTAAVTPVRITDMVEGERDSYGVFTELSVPLIGTDNAMPLVRRLELQLAGRYEDRGDAGSTTVPKVGVSWVPVRSLLLRGSYSQGFRAPALSEYQVAGQVFSASITDPMRGTIAAPNTPAPTNGVQVLRGSNPDIEPETSETTYLGLVYEPIWVRGLNFEVNYYETVQKDVIQVLSAQIIANNQSTFGDRITRGAQTPDDITLNQPGPIIELNQTLINFGKVTNKSLDVVVNYSLSSWAGNMRIGANASHLLESSRELRPGVEAVDDLGDTFAPPKWRYNVFAFWDRGPWNASAYFTYLSAFSTNQAGNLFTSSYPIPSQTKLDLNGGYEFREGLWGGRAKGLRVSFGIGNVLDEEPPFSDTVFGFNGGLHSPLGRTWQTSIQMPFGN